LLVMSGVNAGEGLSRTESAQAGLKPDAAPESSAWPPRAVRQGKGQLRFRRRERFLIAGAILLLVAAAADAFLLEPDWIEVVRTVEYVPTLRSSAPDLLLVHLSDTHVTRLGRRERRALAIINAAQPDLIVITGDLTHHGSDPGVVEAFLSGLHARSGNFLVWGNHDHRQGVADDWGPAAARRAGFTLLTNGNRRIDTPAGRIAIAGLDDPVTGHDNLKAAMAGVPRRDFCILLSHSPEVARDLGNWDIDMVLAGHTHGGQVRLPWVGALWVPAGTRPYIEGWYDVGGARLHVSQGLGWSYLPVRFFCRPRIDLITLRGGMPPGRPARRSSLGRS
jgi:uncharacterized protein